MALYFICLCTLVSGPLISVTDAVSEWRWFLPNCAMTRTQTAKWCQGYNQLRAIFSILWGFIWKWHARERHAVLEIQNSLEGDRLWTLQLLVGSIKNLKELLSRKYWPTAWNIPRLWGTLRLMRQNLNEKSQKWHMSKNVSFYVIISLTRPKIV